MIKTGHYAEVLHNTGVIQMLRYTICLFLFSLWSLPVAAIEKIVVHGLFKNKAIVELDGERRVLSAGIASPEGALLISATSKEAIIEINGIRNSYTLGTHIGSVFTAPERQKTVTIAPDTQGMYFVNGNINGHAVNFIVDTGATFISMSSNHAKQIGLNYKLEGEQALSNTASGIDKIYLVNLKKVQIGDIEVNNIQAAVHTGDFPKDILLGNTFLNNVDMQREGRILQLHKK